MSSSVSFRRRPCASVSATCAEPETAVTITKPSGVTAFAGVKGQLVESSASREISSPLRGSTPTTSPELEVRRQPVRLEPPERLGDDPVVVVLAEIRERHAGFSVRRSTGARSVPVPFQRVMIPSTDEPAQHH